MQFVFSYTFDSLAGQPTISGSFTGEKSGDLITNITDVSLAFDGAIYDGLIAEGWGSGAAVISADLSQTDFWFYHPIEWFPTFSLFFGTELEPGYGASFEDAWGNILSAGWPDLGTWQVDVASVPVPDAGTSLLLLSAALSGVVLLKRRFSGLSA